MTRNLFGGSAIGHSSFAALRARRSASSIAAAAGTVFDALEARQMLAVSILDDIGNRNASRSSSATVISLDGRYDNPAITGTIVRFNSNFGSFNIEMFDQAGEARSRTTPLTVANFLNYITQGRYVNNMIHRTVNNFVIQGGGFTAQPLSSAAGSLFTSVTTNPAVTNEPGNTNARGTIAMARVGGQVNSATSQWFINLANNAGTFPNGLDFVDQGFTVFGRVLGDGMNVVDAIGALPRFNFDNPFGEVPLRNYTTTDFNNERPVHTENLVSFSTIETTSELSFSATSGNTALVTPVIVNNQLVLQYGQGVSGSTNVTVRVTAADGSFVDDTFTVTVSNLDAPGHLAVTPARLNPGATIDLTASGPVFQNPSIMRVEFYRDLNRNGVLDGTEATDGLLDIDDNPGDGFSTTVTVEGAAFGNTSGGQFYIARAFDAVLLGNVVGGTTVVASNSINQAPTIGLFARHEQNFGSTPDVVTNLGDNLEMFALNHSDRDGTVASVQFFRDANGNNTFDNGVDVLLGTDNTPNDGFSLVTSTTGFTTGGNTSVFARAIDNEGAIGAVVALTVRVNAAPTIGTLTFSAANIVRGQAITINANVVADVDSPLVNNSRVGKVDFFRDSNGDGIFQTETDQFFTSITVGTNGTFSLTLTGVQTAAFPSGTNMFFARPTDTDFAFGAAISATIVVGNNAPTITAVTATPNPVANLGANLTLTALGAADSDGTVARVDFFRDANGNNTFDEGVDILIGSDSTPANGFSAIINTGTGGFGFTAGVNRYFAVPFDNDGTRAANPATITSRINAAPSVGSLAINPDPIPRNGSFTLTASNVTDAGEVGAGGTISRVEFYRDTNGNGTLEIGTDTLLGSDLSAVGGYTFTGTATNFSTVNPNRFFARAVDSENGVSVVAMAEALADNSRPTITSVTVTPNPLPALGGNLTLTAAGVADVDGTIARVRFYRDANDNNTFDFGIDTELGQDASAVGGYTLTFAASGNQNFQPGINRLFAVPEDNDGARAANPATVTVRINAVPTIASLSATPTVARGANITLTATGVVDQADSVAAGTIVRVEFYRDANGNGTFDLGVDRLLGVGVRQGTTTTYTLTTTTTGFATGINTYFVRAQDNNLGFSSPSSQADSTTNNITNAAPLITSVSVSPLTVATLGTNITITSVGQRDTDGTLASIQYFRDDGDNIFDANVDFLIGTDNTPATNFVVTSTGFTVGSSNRVWARSVDNDGAFSTAVLSAAFRVNAAPTIGALAATSPIVRGQSITLTATNVIDQGEATAGTITTVQFFRDVNGNGTFDSGTDRLLGAGIRQTNTNTWVLTTTTTGFDAGTNTFFARATDNTQGLSTVDANSTTTATITNRTPNLTSVTATPNPVVSLGSNVTLTSAGATDPDGTIASVQFFRDDGDGLFDANVDTLLGTDNSAVGGFSLVTSTGSNGFVTGTNRVFARSVDNNGGFSTAVTTTFRINAAPVVGDLDHNGPVTRGSTITLTAGAVVDTAETNGGLIGTITRVEFFLDSNNNGTFDPATDRRLGADALAAGGYTLTIATTGFPLNARFFARAVDNNTGAGTTINEVATVTATILNNTPTITSLTDTPDPVATLGNNLTLTAIGSADRDGTIAAVQFFRDDGDGLFDANVDTLLGTDTSAVGGFTLVTSTGSNGFVTGTNRYFARVMDNDGGFSNAVTTTGRVNAAPTIGSVANPNTVARGQNVTLSAQNVVDIGEAPNFTGTITSVKFYRDINNNGTIEPLVDRLLGSGVRQLNTNNFNLTFSTTGFATGNNTVLVQATDNNLGLSAITAVTVAVTNANPTFTSTSISPLVLPFLGQNITVTPVGARDTDGTIATVLFFLETTGDTDLQPDQNAVTHDLLIGEDASATGGWSLAINTLASLGFQVGANRIYACVIDNDGGNVAIGQNFTITSANAAATVTAVNATVNPVTRGTSTTLVATGLADDGAVQRVEFFRDANGNSTFDLGIDPLLGSGTVIAGQATLLVPTLAFNAGTNTVFARGIDNRTAPGPVTAGTVTVNNRNPLITSLTATPNPVVTLGNNLTLTAVGVSDPDRTVAAVDFFFDLDNDGLLNPVNDILLGTDTSATGGYNLIVNTGNANFNLAAGTNRFFARVTDSDGGTAVAQITNRINGNPGIGDMEVNPIQVSRTGSFTVTFTDVTDDLAVTGLQLFRDSNLSNDFEATDLLVGNATRVGTTSTWTFTGAGSLLPVGIYKLFGRARDASGAFSGISFTVVQVVA